MQTSQTFAVIYFSRFYFTVYCRKWAHLLKSFLWIFTKCNGHGVKKRPGPRDFETRDPGPGTPLKVEKWHPGPSSKFKSRTPGPPLKFKSETLVIIFLHCLTYFVLDKYIYNVEIIFHDGIVGVLSYILCSELIYHFREITLGVPNLVGDGEIHATCLASNLPDNSWN